MLLVQGQTSALNRVKHADVLNCSTASLPLPPAGNTPRKPVDHGGGRLCRGDQRCCRLPSALAGVLAIAAGCMDWREVGALSSKVDLLIVVSSLALGGALTATGGTICWRSRYLWHWCAELPPEAIILADAAGGADDQLRLWHNAAAASRHADRHQHRDAAGVSPQAFILAVLLGANFVRDADGLPVNLLVMGAAGCKFADFPCAAASRCC